MTLASPPADLFQRDPAVPRPTAVGHRQLAMMLTPKLSSLRNCDRSFFFFAAGFWEEVRDDTASTYPVSRGTAGGWPRAARALADEPVGGRRGRSARPPREGNAPGWPQLKALERLQRDAAAQLGPVRAPGIDERAHRGRGAWSHRGPLMVGCRSSEPGPMG